MSALFSPIQLRGLSLANRIMVAPMCQYSAVDGEASVVPMRSKEKPLGRALG